MRIAILNVKYSPNLGDGLLAECLERELARQDAGITTVAIDLAGRGGYGGHGRNRSRALRVLDGLPGPLRRIAARAALTLIGEVKLRPAFRAALSDCDAAVIGGGNLFADADLNFPVKIALGLAEASRRDLPVAVFAVGVSDNWSGAGERLFAHGLTRARLVGAAVRDERSQEIWNRKLAPHGVMPAEIARDPGLLAVRCYPAAAQPAGERTVAFCITDPLAVRYHGGEHGGDAALRDWYGTTIAALADAGWTVELFTNGSPEDRAFLDAQAPAWTARADRRVRQREAFDTPAELVAALAQVRLVIAHRMHACIAAYSYRVPAIGLRWDAKLDSFFDLSGRADHMADTTACNDAAMVGMAERAVAAGVEPERHAALLAAASASVAALAVRLAAAVRTPT